MNISILKNRQWFDTYICYMASSSFEVLRLEMVRLMLIIIIVVN